MLKNNLSSIQQGILFMVLSAFFYAVNGAIVKLLSPAIPIAECMVFRYIVALFFVVPVMIRQKTSFWGNRKKLIWLRCFLGFTASLLQYYVFTKLNLAYAMSLLYTSPLFVGVLSCFFLKEAINKTLLSYIAISFVGCVLIIQPKWDLQLVYSVLCLISAICTAGAQMVIRKLHHTDSFLTIVFNFLFWSGVISLLLSLSHFVLPNLMQLFGLLCLGLFGGIAQMSMTYAFKFAQSNVLSPYSYSVVMFSALFEWILWGGMLNLVAMIGVVVVITCGVAIASWNQKLKTI